MISTSSAQASPSTNTTTTTTTSVVSSSNGPVASTSISKTEQNEGMRTSSKMTITEMRELHHRALSEAEAKRTELRLVLASRYRDLVGSSDEVMKMKERSGELDDLVRALPDLAERLMRCSKWTLDDFLKEIEQRKQQQQQQQQQQKQALEEESGSGGGANKKKKEEEMKRQEDERQIIIEARRDMFHLPRLVHRHLDRRDVHGAASALVKLFTIVASITDQFPLATALSNPSQIYPTLSSSDALDSSLLLQTKMTYLHLQTIPSRCAKLARSMLLRPSADIAAAAGSASALTALDMLHVRKNQKQQQQQSIAGDRRAHALVDLYFESKAQLVRELLDRLSTTTTAAVKGGDTSSSSTTTTTVTPAVSTVDPDYADQVLSKIVSILQRDVILHPYHIFVLGRYVSRNLIAPSPHNNDDNEESKQSYHASDHLQALLDKERQVMASLPKLSASVLKAKTSRFLAAHLPLIRTRVRTILMSVAGTTASRLGSIRQSLYDKTDGLDVMAELNAEGPSTWDQAVEAVVDLTTVSAHGVTVGTAADAPTATPSSSRTTLREGGDNNAPKRLFSLWSALFSNTFSSLVHSILTTSFHSVHSRVVATVRSSLRAAPPPSFLLPHEAHANTHRIATDLDLALHKVGEDAHELLVHAEEREESERRLRQSLYVQTCEIMGRLLCELRRTLPPPSSSSSLHGENSIFGSFEEEKKNAGSDRDEEATASLVVGRLCHLLKFRLSSLPALLDPKSSPSAMMMMSSSSSSSTTKSSRGGSGSSSSTSSSSAHGTFVTLAALHDAFSLADADDDGLISFDDAMVAMEGAFSGTPFRGAEMVRDTLLLSSSSSTVDGADMTSTSNINNNDPANSTTTKMKLSTAATNTTASSSSSSSLLSGPKNVTRSELALLAARGLRHDTTGPESALGLVQQSLDDIVSMCFSRWSSVTLEPCLTSLRSSLAESITTGESSSDLEWRRMMKRSDESHSSSMENSSNNDNNMGASILSEEANELKVLVAYTKSQEERMATRAKLGQMPSSTAAATNADMMSPVSSFVSGYFVSLSSIFHRSSCPSDALPPVPSLEYAKALGIDCLPKEEEDEYTIDSIPTLMQTIRGSLLGEAVTSMTFVLEKELTRTYRPNSTQNNNNHDDDIILVEEEVPILEQCGNSSLLQLWMDSTFIIKCFFERNQYPFILPPNSLTTTTTTTTTTTESQCRTRMKRLSDRILQLLRSRSIIHGNVGGMDQSDPLYHAIETRHMQAFASSDLYLSALFGEDASFSSSSSSMGSSTLSSSSSFSSSSSVPPLLRPLPSSRRFMLLPIQHAERSLKELQLRGKYGKDKGSSDDAKNGGEDDEREGMSSLMSSSGFGFFSTMLQKRK